MKMLIIATYRHHGTSGLVSISKTDDKDPSKVIFLLLSIFCDCREKEYKYDQTVLKK